MIITISDFRKNLFQLMEKALTGDVVEVAYKGRTVRLIAETPGSKLDRLTPAQIANPKFSEADQERASRELFAEMQQEWEKDWAEL
jgi:prevent-host-death family protein